MISSKMVIPGGVPWGYNTNQLLIGLKDDHIGYNPTDEQLSCATTLMNDYILPKCWDMIVEITDKEDTTGYTWLGEFLSWLNGTQEKYTLLINYYANNKDKLMDTVINSVDSTATTNDTPQDEGNDWGNDLHVSTVGKNHTESKNTGGTVLMDNLATIQNRYRNLYQMWMKDFIKEFRCGGNW